MEICAFATMGGKHAGKGPKRPAIKGRGRAAKKRRPGKKPVSDVRA